jgi:hypothetical protein
LAAFAALSDLTWPGDLKEDDHSNSPTVEQQFAMVTIQLGVIPTPLTKHKDGWSEGQNNLNPTNFQRAADYYVRKAWKTAFAPIASTFGGTRVVLSWSLVHP